MASNTLERTVTKILDQVQERVISELDDALKESTQMLDDKLADLEAEYNHIISDGHKEADKIKKQIVGGADLDARNKQLMVVEEAVAGVFDKVVDRISTRERNDSYAQLIEVLMKEAVDAMGSANIMVCTSEQDRDAVGSVLNKFPGSTLSDERIQCLGGMRVTSRDGTMTFDNTLDARISRLKPLIRKQIVDKFRGELIGSKG